MTRASERGIFPRFFSCILLAGLTLALCSEYRDSVFLYTDKHRLIGRLTVRGGFWHEYMHSINKSLVREKIIVRNGEFVIEEGWFKDYSTGIDSGTGKGFRTENGWFVLSLDRHEPELFIAVSPVQGHAIETGGRAYPLSRWAKPGEILVFRTKLY